MSDKPQRAIKRQRVPVAAVEDGTQRPFQVVYQGILEGKITLAVTAQGVSLVEGLPRYGHFADMTQFIDWDTVADTVAYDIHGDTVSLLDCFKHLRPASVKFVTETTNGDWGDLHQPITGRFKVLVQNTAFAILTSALIGSFSHDEHTAEVCDKVFKLMTALNALNTILPHKLVVARRNIGCVMKRMWTGVSELDLENFKQQNAEHINRDPLIQKVLAALSTSTSKNIYGRVMQAISETQPLSKLREIADIATINQVMDMSPERDAYRSYFVTVAMEEWSRRAESEKKIEPPPYLTILLQKSNDYTRKNPGYQQMLMTGGVIELSQDPDVSILQTSALARFYGTCVYVAGIYILQRVHDVRSISDEDIQKRIENKKANVTAQIIDDDLKQIHETHRLQGEYKGFNWRHMLNETFRSIQEHVTVLIRDYLTTNTMKMLAKDEEHKERREYSSIEALAVTTMKAFLMNATDFAQFNKASTGARRPQPYDYLVSGKCVSVNLKFDHVDSLERLNVARKVFEAVERLPDLVLTLGTMYLYYFRYLNLREDHTIIEKIYRGIKEEISKDVLLRDQSSGLARDFFYLICRAAGHPDANTISQFMDLQRTAELPLLQTKESVIYEGGGDLHTVDTSLITKFIPEEEEEKNKPRDRTDESDSPTKFRVTIFSARAKCLKDFEYKEIIAALASDPDVAVVEKGPEADTPPLNNVRPGDALLADLAATSALVTLSRGQEGSDHNIPPGHEEEGMDPMVNAQLNALQKMLSRVMQLPKYKYTEDEVDAVFGVLKNMIQRSDTFPDLQFSNSGEKHLIYSLFAIFKSVESKLPDAVTTKLHEIAPKKVSCITKMQTLVQILLSESYKGDEETASKENCDGNQEEDISRSRKRVREAGEDMDHDAPRLEDDTGTGGGNTGTEEDGNTSNELEEDEVPELGQGEGGHDNTIQADVD